VVRFDVTRIVRDWASGARVNNGVLIRTALEETGGIDPEAVTGVPTVPTLRVYYTLR
jgi:hypothetical protein